MILANPFTKEHIVGAIYLCLENDKNPTVPITFKLPTRAFNLQTTSHSYTLLENHLKFVDRLFSSSADDIWYDTMKLHQNSISPFRSIQISIFKHLRFF